MERKAHGQYQKFLTSKQEPLRLSSALEEFFRDDVSEENRAAYLAYLQRRIRPAMKQLVIRDDSVMMQRISEQITLPADIVDDALAMAVTGKKISAMVWLLRWKQHNSGFEDRDFSL